MISIGIVGAGQFSGQFAKLFKVHPDVDRVVVTDILPERAADLMAREGLAGTVDSFEALLASDVDAVAIFTQRWTHGPLVVAALRAGKHVYSAVPMAISEDEIRQIIEAVRETGLTYMMGETSHYNPATVFARKKVEEGAFGRVFYAEGDYVHDMDLGFYDAYRYSGGAEWKRTASYPPMLYPTHSVGGVLGAIPGHAVSVSCIGVRDERDDGVFDREISQFDNDFSNASALFELDNGGVMRINEMRRVGYPCHIRESRFRYFGTDASFEQLATVSFWQDTEDGARRHGSTLDGQEHVPGRPGPRPRRSGASRIVHLGARPGARQPAAAGRLPRDAERARGKPPFPGRRLRPSRGGRDDTSGQCLGRGSLHPAWDRRPPVCAAPR
jgi:predicted dehydrogenase